MSLDATRPRAGARVLAAAVLGVLLAQAAWVLVVPPFRGLDEHDHAYKAAAVARGDWSGHHVQSSGNWGELVAVPRDLVEAARPECERLPYTTEANCTPGAATANGNVLVASSAARYNPVFYWVIGTVALPFDGAAALYAMRAGAAGLCALLLGLAWVTTRRWARTAWPGAALLLAATPMLVYSTSVAAPNGVEASAAVLVWSALLGVARGSAPDHDRRYFLVMATIGAVPLVTVRVLGPLWLAMIVGTVAVLLGWRRVHGLLRQRPALACAAVVSVATVAGVAWTLAAAPNAPSTSTHHFRGSGWSALPANWVLWFFQAIAAFPARDEMAPLPLYAIALVAWWLFVSLAVWGGGRRTRWVLLLVVAAATAVPAAITVLTYSELGPAWQGRYGYPYAMGFILLCGLAVDRSGLGGRGAWPAWAAAAVCGVTQAIGQLNVLADQARTSPQADTAAWIQPAPWLVVALVLVATALLAVAATSRRATDAVETTVRPLDTLRR